LIDSGESFQSIENPLVYSGPIVNDLVAVSVIAPFHDNVNPTVNPSVTATVV